MNQISRANWDLGASFSLKSMKLFFGLIVLALIAGSIFADYKWRRWMAARKLERERDPDLRA